ncbi:hypothetical protein [Robbsia sp. KACC 23696]|uniref:hypothetical protein n=1 Tax=Robbsia sp. KACC 23696 TaxID=3149231 RepID=UPI00325AA619
MTKQFRILTGCHAGARLNLQYGIWTVGSSEQADVQISDWEGETMFLEYRSDGTVTMTPPAGKAPSKSVAQTLLDWMPRRNGQTVFCVGPADAEWPSEVSLFEKLLQAVEVAKADDGAAAKAAGADAPAAPLSRREQIISEQKRADGALKKRWAYSGGAGVVVVGLIVGLTLVLTDGSSEKARAAIRPTPVAPTLTLAEQQDKSIREALLRLNETDVTVTHADGRIVLGGIVASAGDALAIRRALQDLAAVPHSSTAKAAIDQRYSVAANIADDLQSSLGDRHLTVHYDGQGVFTVSGPTHNLDSMRTLLSRTQNDYGGRIRRINDRMTQASLPSTGAEAMLDADGVRYIQMPDGSKSFAPDPTPDPAVAAATTGADGATALATGAAATTAASGTSVTAAAAATSGAATMATATAGAPVALAGPAPLNGATENAGSVGNVSTNVVPRPHAISQVAPIVVKSMATPLASTLPPGEAPLPSQP